ncbi:MAG: 2-keto-4-pentenoate hydratase [Rubrobacteraceae bacterium]
MADVEALARRLDEAWENKTPIAPLTDSDGLRVEDSYAVQSRWTKLRMERGERIFGRKIGLTSAAMQNMMNVNEPDYGSLWSSRYFAADSKGRAEIPTDAFIYPRVEGEIAFLMAKPLSGDDVSAEEVLAATEALAVSVEVVDSRIKDWKIKLADTIADNASYGGYTLGPWDEELVGEDLRTLGMIVSKNGESAIEAVGAAALGNPANGVAWLARKLHSFGVSLNPGDVVLSGSLGGAVDARKGDSFTVEVHGQPPLAAEFV